MTEPTTYPNRRAASKVRTAAKVLEAARTLFAAEGGYEAATIRSIAKAAGMSTGAVFANYDSKEVLYEAIYGHKPITPELGKELLNAALEAKAALIATQASQSHGDAAVFAERINRLDAAIAPIMDPYS